MPDFTDLALGVLRLKERTIQVLVETPSRAAAFSIRAFSCSGSRRLILADWSSLRSVPAAVPESST
jgi:hypothetical protein